MAVCIFGKEFFVRLSDEELELYGNEFARLCHDSGRTITFERFIQRKAIADLVFAESMYKFMERKRA